MRKIITTTILLLISYIAFGQSITFSKRFYFNYPAVVFTDVYATDTMYYVTGIATNPNNSNYTGSLFARFDLLGNCIDSGAIYSTNREYETWENTLRPIGENFIVNGYGDDSGGMYAILIKYNKFGDTLWTKIYRNPTSSGGFIVSSDLLPSVDSGYFFAATITDMTLLKSSFNILKLDSIGNIEWDTILSSPSIHRFYGRLLKKTSNFIVCFIESNVQSQGATGNFISKHTYKEFDSIGTFYWTKSPLPSNLLAENAYDITLTQDGGYLVGSSYGVKGQNGSFHYLRLDGFVYKLDSAFNFVWGKRLWGDVLSTYSNVRNVFEQPDSSIIAIGTLLYIWDTGVYSITKGVVTKLSPQGDSLWQRRYYIVSGQNDRNDINDAQQTPDGGFIICGESRGVVSGQPQQQGWLLKLDSMGCLVPGCHITAVDVAQTPDAGKIDIKVFPNPAVDYINVYVPRVMSYDVGSLHATTLHHTTLQLHLYDLNGRLLQNHTLPQSDATYMLTTEGLASGLYLLQVLDGEGRVLGTEKVVVK